MTKRIEDNLELVGVTMPAKLPIRSKIPLLDHPPPDNVLVVLVSRCIKLRLDGIPIRFEFWILGEFLLHRVKLVLLLDERFVIANLYLVFLLCDDILG